MMIAVADASSANAGDNVELGDVLTLSGLRDASAA